MNILNTIFTIFSDVFNCVVIAMSSYFLIISLFGLYKKKSGKNIAPQKSFALLVAAHNEEAVVSDIVESLKKLDYPKELFDIFVIADNCTDKTAEKARKRGALVYERFNKEKRGKGYALEWMFDNLFKMDKKYDAVCIFDADNLVSKNFLNEMNKKLCDGFKVVQGYLDSKNPKDTWITGAYSITFWTNNRMFQLARENMGLSSQLGGTGFAIDTSILKTLGWGATCLTEDLEFSCKLVMSGEKVGWAHDAIIYDEKPLKLKQSWNQRKRWMQGFTDVASRYFFKLIKKSIVERKFYMFDCALYVLQPFITLLLAISAVLTLIQINTEGVNIFIINYLFSDVGFKVFALVQFLITPVVLAVEKKVTKPFLVMMALYSSNIFAVPYLASIVGDWRIGSLVGIGYNILFLILTGIFLGKKDLILFFRFWLYGLYTLTWIPITIQGILNKNNKEWNHTKHVRKIEICDV